MFLPAQGRPLRLPAFNMASSRRHAYASPYANRSRCWLKDHQMRSRLLTGLMGRCPRCGTGKLFAGFLALRPRCEHCGLEFSFADSADAPAVFLIFISGAIVAGSALAVEMIYSPPYWVHALLWGPLILLTTLVPLRPIKGLMIGLQFHYKA